MLHASIMMMTMLLLFDDDDGDDQNALNLKLRISTDLFTAFVYSCVYACPVLPTWFACLAESFMEVPLACLTDRGGQVMTLNQVKYLVYLN